MITPVSLRNCLVIPNWTFSASRRPLTSPLSSPSFSASRRSEQDIVGSLCSKI